jgi:hypothetical protein
MLRVPPLNNRLLAASLILIEFSRLPAPEFRKKPWKRFYRLPALPLLNACDIEFIEELIQKTAALS